MFCIFMLSVPQGKTVVYNKGGYFLNTFPSLLPGGNNRDRRRSGNGKCCQSKCCAFSDSCDKLVESKVQNYLQGFHLVVPTEIYFVLSRD